MNKNYDERQELLRGRGATYALFTIIVLNFILFFLESVILESMEVQLPMSAGTAGIISILIGVAVDAIYCIWKEAYVSLKLNVKTTVGVLLVIAAINLVRGIDALKEGAILKNNQITSRGLNLLCGIELLVICGILILKTVCKGREEE